MQVQLVRSSGNEHTALKSALCGCRKPYFMLRLSLYQFRSVLWAVWHKNVKAATVNYKTAYFYHVKLHCCVLLIKGIRCH